MGAKKKKRIQKKTQKKAQLRIVDKGDEIPERLVRVPEDASAENIKLQDRERYLKALMQEREDLRAAQRMAVECEEMSRAQLYAELETQSMADTVRLRAYGNYWYAMGWLEMLMREIDQVQTSRWVNCAHENKRAHRALKRVVGGIVSALDPSTCPECGEPGEVCEANECDESDGPEYCDSEHVDDV